MIEKLKIKTIYNDFINSISLTDEQIKILNDIEFVEKYLDDRYPRICFNNITIGEFSTIAPKGHFVATMNGHITAIIDNIIVDTFNCYDRKMKCCWKIM